MAGLKDILPRAFFDSPYFSMAVTHQSAGFPNNERLEFLGDAVLELVISEILYLRFDGEDEGYLTKLRAHLVCKSTLTELAEEYRVGEWMKLGPSEDPNNVTKSILANAFEAIVAAVYLEQGWDAVKEFVGAVYAGRLDSTPDLENLKDSKTRLQEYLQSQGYALPDYRSVDIPFDKANPQFEVQCVVDELHSATSGRGGSKRAAEQEAAASMLELLEIQSQ